MIANSMISAHQQMIHQQVMMQSITLKLMVDEEAAWQRSGLGGYTVISLWEEQQAHLHASS